ncbi:Protodermal factor 1 [Abeliophyllum distichum]|uniref:Protodermal factor 1 n=1 Tax=Abeliophyllum distichum TaxID=126358 RepID=A0ABD1PTL7_9LAMI
MAQEDMEAQHPHMEHLLMEAAAAKGTDHQSTVVTLQVEDTTMPIHLLLEEAVVDTITPLRPLHQVYPALLQYQQYYWRTHPGLIWSLFGWCGTVGRAFGFTSLSGFGANMNLLQALSNSRTDGIEELYRKVTAALLNSMVHRRFPYTTKQVRDIFTATLSSNKAAAAQAQLFKLANEGRIKPQA